MSAWTMVRASALLRLHRAQTRVVTRIVPGIATEAGASAAPHVVHLEGPRGGRYIMQRVTVERTFAGFDAQHSFAAADAEWNADGTACRLVVTKADGGVRLELSTRDGEFHSVTTLHGGRALQLTSFSDELDLPADVADAAGVDQDPPVAHEPSGHETLRTHDPISAETLAEPPEFPAASHSATGGRDPRAERIAREELEAGPDYGYRLRTAN